MEIKYNKLPFKSEHFDFIEVLPQGSGRYYQVRLKTTVGFSLIGMIGQSESIGRVTFDPRGNLGDSAITAAGLSDILEFMKIVDSSNQDNDGKQIS